MSGKIVVVSGVGHVVGSALAQKFAQQGDTVIAVGKGNDAERQAAQRLEIEFRAIDGTQLADADRAFDEIVNEWGSVDALVNYVADGCDIASTAQDISWDLWHQVIDDCLTTPMFISISAGRKMAAQGKGKIVNVVLSAGLFSSPLTNPAYAAACNGVVCATRNMARDILARGINANSVVVGAANDDFFAQADTEQIEAEMAWVPAGRKLEPTDVFGAVELLTSEQGDYISGACIDVNGGLYYR